MPRIALVDDDRNLLSSVSIALESEGYVVDTYSDGATALEGMAADPVDLAILDLGMPRMDGVEMLRRLRARSSVPVILLTARRTEADQFVGFRMGADDYVSKPFSTRVLSERIRAVLRRGVRVPEQAETAPRKGEPDRQILESGRLRMDLERHHAWWNDFQVRLTVTEFAILRALAQRPGVLKGRHDLIRAAFDEDMEVSERTIDSHVKRVRRKFEQVDPGFDGIRTVYGEGYIFEG